MRLLHQELFKAKRIEGVVFFDPSLKDGQEWYAEGWLELGMDKGDRFRAMAFHIGKGK